jgi:uncharacterized protein DUF3383
MSNNTLPLSLVCNVSIFVSPVAAATPTFNQALIVGPSTIIPTSGAGSRVRQYASIVAMEADGFTVNMPEHIAAALYFGQSPAPQLVWVGRQDLTATETCLAAVQACRLASPNWWGCMVTGAVTADHEAIAAWMQAAVPMGMYFYTTSDSAVLAGTTGNVMVTLQTALYSRVWGIYSTTQSSAFPNNIYAAAAVMGVVMGLNTGLANSFFTAKFRQLVGIAPEPITLAQVQAIEALNGNVYVSTANVYNWLEQGKVANGQFLDEVLNLDMLASDLQFSMINEFIAAPSIPQTDNGEMVLINAGNQVGDRAVARGFLAPGVWRGQTVLNLTPGTPLPKGYSFQAQSFAVQSQADRDLRKAMPLYMAVHEAGAMHSLLIGVYVQR